MSYLAVTAAMIMALLPAEAFLHAAKRSPQDAEAPSEVSVCGLKKDAGAFDHKLIRLTGFVSHGFEDFAIYDPECSDWPQIWLEYGGRKGSNTTYCCGVTPKQTRSSDLSVDNIRIPLVVDHQFQRFDKMVKTEFDSTIHATLIGRFFSGRREKYPDGHTEWGGYGHMGCCSLFVIQQIVSLDSHDRTDLDYRSSPDQPNMEKVGCGYDILSDDWRFSEALTLQRKAESGERSWAFDDPRRVATEVIAQHARNQAVPIEPKISRTAQGRIIYAWKPARTKTTYMVVVSRPYTLSFYATNPQKVSWVPIAAYRAGCDKNKMVRRIK